MSDIRTKKNNTTRSRFSSKYKDLKNSNNEEVNAINANNDYDDTLVSSGKKILSKKKTLKIKVNNATLFQQGQDEDELKFEKIQTDNVTSKSYESKTLQNDIENLKKLRLNYGTDWLLTSPELKNSFKETIKSPPGYEKKFDNKSNLSEEKSFNRVSSSSKIGPETNNILDSFVIYRAFADKEESDDEVIILTLSESFLIEKDELNVKYLFSDLYTNLENIQLMTNDEADK